MVCVPSSALVDYLYDMLLARMPGFAERYPMVVSVVVKGIFVVAAFLSVLLAQVTGVEIFNWVAQAFGDATKWVFDNTYVPFSAIFIETAKILFANEFVNTKVLEPRGVADIASGELKSAAFMLETSFGPGLGVLLAALAAGPKCLRAGVLFALVALVVGGIHEVYFPYVYMMPQLLVALVVGGFFGQVVVDAADLGFTAAPRPGSAMAIVDVTTDGEAVGVILYLTLSALVSFALGWFLLSSPLQKIRACLRLGRKKQDVVVAPTRGRK